MVQTDTEVPVALRKVLHIRPNLGSIQGQSVFWHEVLSRSANNSVSLKLTWPCFSYNRDTGSHRNTKAMYGETGCGYKTYNLENW